MLLGILGEINRESKRLLMKEDNIRYIHILMAVIVCHVKVGSIIYTKI